MATPENEVQMSKRDRQLGRLRERYPDKTFEDDEEIYGQIGEDYDNYEAEIGGYKERERALSDMFANDPRSAQFLAEWAHGESPVISLLKYFGPDIKNVLDDPEKMRELSEAWAEEQERLVKSRQLDDEYAENMTASLEALRQYQEEKGLTDEQCDEVISSLIQIVRNGVMGIFDKQGFEFALNAINHDDDVAVAQEEGTVAGRNEKVMEKLRKTDKGDGVAPLGGKNNTQPVNARGMDIFDLAAQA